ncbi:Syntaxin-61 [Ranunculus cassubicifolius]
MSSAQDPFYVVKEEIQQSIDKLQHTFHQWENVTCNISERAQQTKELINGCESIEWQVDELDKAIAVAANDPAWYGIDQAELEKRRSWTSSARSQVTTVKKIVNGTRQELMRQPINHRYSHTSRPNNQYQNDDFISSESDRQMLLIRQQDNELDVLSESVTRIGDVGLTIHEELSVQEKIMSELELDTESTSNRLDFVQKKIAVVMKKAGAKGQIMMIVFLLILFIVLFVLVFLT